MGISWKSNAVVEIYLRVIRLTHLAVKPARLIKLNKYVKHL